MKSQAADKKAPLATPARVYIYPENTTTPVQSTGMLLSDIFADIRAYKWLVLGTTLGAAVLFVLISFLFQPMYRAMAIYAPAPSQSSTGSRISGGVLSALGSLGGIGVSGGGTSLGMIVAKVSSSSVTIAALEDEHALPILFPDRWDWKKNTWRANDPDLFGNPPTHPTQEPTPAQIMESFNALRTVNSDVVSNTITVSVIMPDAGLSARLANRLAYYVNEDQRARTKQDAARAVVLLDAELKKTSQTSLQESITQLLQLQLQQEVLASATKDYVVQVVDPAVVPYVKTSPKRSLFAVFGLFLGGVLGTLIAIYLRRRRTAVLHA
jgi:uncharacterized protein involved in exopolysaccharide biosynthesis